MFYHLIIIKILKKFSNKTDYQNWERKFMVALKMEWREYIDGHVGPPGTARPGLRLVGPARPNRRTGSCRASPRAALTTQAGPNMPRNKSNFPPSYWAVTYI
jgi:hypothetical protein